MKRLALIFTALAVLLTLTAAPAFAQEKSAASSLGIIVFPAKGQTADQQKKDESDCFNWAKQNTGIDPNAPASAPAPTPADQKGGAVKGAAKGAAAGALVGAAAGDAGKGAAVGAAAGGVGGRRQQKKGNKAAQEGAQAQAQSADQAKIDTFKKGMSACLEGKGYTIK